ncbi:protein kinase [Aliivibrio salmonicida]|jgi:serine/threonine protein kinase|uniref:Type VI secretion protein VasX-1 n=1 Tax=Aliivibrio salmonicida (strain LFI1238) TaxID=316275 RepID=B6EJK6_ALISL|nr:type VI secretion protein VasX-1 [Aliivibrio salmonicida]AZL84507.1 protein kinase [Aliivibrio salmonicida]CAQ78870.1 putative type VI secretion protein VasX-1 [Aliivibrio salmonicida LFI1238]
MSSKEFFTYKSFFHCFLLDGENWDLSKIGKHYINSKDMEREWEAVNECAGLYVQKPLSLDVMNSVIYFEYDSTAKPLSSFDKNNAKQFLWILPKIIRAIKHCHDKGWVHGDIKPSNILFIPALTSIRLIDFGASYRIGTSRKTLSCWQATPSFASPSQLQGKGLVKKEDDWYALTKIIDQLIDIEIEPRIQKKAMYIRNVLMNWV